MTRKINCPDECDKDGTRKTETVFQYLKQSEFNVGS